MPLDINTNIIQILDGFEKWENNIAQLLMNNDDLFKLLWYEDNDPLSKIMTPEIKENMIFEFDSKMRQNPGCRVFFRKFTGDTETSSKAQLRIYPVRVKPSDIYYGDMMFRIDCIVHMAIDKIKNGQRRHKIASEVLKSINGQEIQMVQRVTIRDMFEFISSQQPHFDGWSLIFNTGVSAIG